MRRDEDGQVKKTKLEEKLKKKDNNYTYLKKRESTMVLANIVVLNPLNKLLLPGNRIRAGQG